jgi:hypothetical protein
MLRRRYAMSANLVEVQLKSGAWQRDGVGHFFTSAKAGRVERSHHRPSTGLPFPKFFGI